MIMLYSGKPGSGKSYRCVSDLLEKGLSEKYYIFHNIDGLKSQKFECPDHVKDWSKYCSDEKINFRDFFTKEYQEALSTEIESKYHKRLMIVIDEAQDFLDKSDDKIKKWLTYHRHLGQEIKLITHGDRSLHMDYRVLIEFELRAKHGKFINVPMFFVYRKIVAGEGIGASFTFKRKEIFGSYKSFMVGDGKIKMSYAVPVFIVGLFIAGWWLFSSPERIMADGKEEGYVTDSKKVYGNVVEEKEYFQPMANSMVKDKPVHELNVCRMDSVQRLKRDYVYRGHFNNEIIIEEVKTGQQFYLSDVAPFVLVMGVEGTRYCTLFDKAKEETYRLFAGRNRIEEDEKGERFGFSRGEREKANYLNE